MPGQNLCRAVVFRHWYRHRTSDRGSVSASLMCCIRRGHPRASSSKSCNAFLLSDFRFQFQFFEFQIRIVEFVYYYIYNIYIIYIVNYNFAQFSQFSILKYWNLKSEIWKILDNQINSSTISGIASTVPAMVVNYIRRESQPFREIWQTQETWSQKSQITNHSYQNCDFRHWLKF